MKKKIILLIVLLFCFTSVSSAQQMVNAKVIRIIKGDTVETADPKFTVRICGITTPDISQPFGSAARDILGVLSANKMATIKFVTKDTAYVYVDEYDIGLHMVSLGYATVNKSELDRSSVGRYLEAESTARIQKKGMWRDKPRQGSLVKHQ